MNRRDAERIVTEHLKPIFGFALKRCKSVHDAEDLSGEIVLRAFRALLAKDEITDASKFVWTIAHNMLSNYYRDAAAGIVGVSVDELAERLADPDADQSGEDNAEAIRRLQSEIAYLSGLQRRIVIAYYFENRKQAEIAAALGIPLGTVKWHLFEAKKELKRGMDTVRKASELKFNPIKFSTYGTSGAIGTKTTDEFLRSTLTQNICYSVRDTAKTVHEIADDLGVSPVYVETEVEFLEKYGLLQQQKEKYIANFIISEPTAALLALQNEAYRRGAALFANDLYDALTASGILDDPDILCGQTDAPLTLTSPKRTDRNFLLWALIPYVTACTGKGLQSGKISFEEVATVRPDGAHNILYASVTPDGITFPDGYVSMKDWRGPYLAHGRSSCLWQIDSEWSEQRIGVTRADDEITHRILSLYEKEAEEGDVLSEGEYAWLAERGLIKTAGEYDGFFKASWQAVILASKDVRERLLAIGEEVKQKHRSALEAIKAPYAEAVLATVPTHLKRVKEYELQQALWSDARFLLHCLVALLESGRMQPPTEGQRKALGTLILSD